MLEKQEKGLKLKLHIKNFQAIESLNIEFSGFTVITGKSNAGKSCIRRAIETLFYNKWNEGFLRLDSNYTYIEMNINDNIISCKRGNGSNSFCVNDKKYNKIGQSNVPTEYKDIGISKLHTNNDSYNINIANQFESLFLISYSDTESTRILNKVISVDILEEASRLASNDITNLKSEATKLKQEVTTLDDKFNKMNSLIAKMGSIVETTKKLNVAITLCKKLISDSSKLNSLNNKLKSLQYDLTLHSSSIVYKNLTSLIISQKRLKILKFLNFFENFRNLLSILFKYKIYKQTIKLQTINQTNNKLTNLQTKKRKKLLLFSLTSLQLLFKHHSNFSSLIKYQSTLYHNQSLYSHTLTQLQPFTCQTCGSIIGKDKLTELENEKGA